MRSAANCELSPKEGRFFVSLKLCDDAMMAMAYLLVVCPFVRGGSKGRFEGY
jgi:hypothetical protein